jgi:hypothetical protein
MITRPIRVLSLLCLETSNSGGGAICAMVLIAWALIVWTLIVWGFYRLWVTEKN